MNSCLECRYYQPEAEPDTGGRRPCFRYPAIEFKRQADWCGEFKPTKATRNADTVEKAPAVSL